MTDYNERYVAFVDILGFRDHIRSINTNPEKLEKLLEILSEMATHYPALSQNMSATQGFENMLRVSTFSDNIVISGQLDPMGFTIVTTVCATLCARLLTQGVYARGAITIGRLHHTSSVVLGEGLVRAYELESRTAIYPRVIFDDSVISLACNVPETNIWKAKQDVDGLYFMDYLVLGPLILGPPSPREPILSLVRSEIVSDLENSNDPRVKSKVEWLARYLNDNSEALQMERIPLS
ncbi:hypothetical protein [Pseudomonas putida]|uniref:hypothetical protein n=1 Tax=Pseudomonas putida TaxID=303 RepID=UPI000CD3EA2B|nr:hypothetical protein [Pseudomonas putida]POF85730.1 hypothetical protein BGP81_25335 [Pseudomonas putida]